MFWLAGWQRMALQILYFVPYNLLQPAASFSAISQKLLVSPVLKKLVFLNSPEEVLLQAVAKYPVVEARFVGMERIALTYSTVLLCHQFTAYQAHKAAGHDGEDDCREGWLLQTLRWIEDIASNWDFRRIIPAHFTAPVRATPHDLRC